MTLNHQEHRLAPLREQDVLLTNRYELTMAAIPAAHPPLVELIMAQGRLLPLRPLAKTCRDYFLSELELETNPWV